MQKTTSLLKRFRSDERGAFLVLFGVLALVLVAMSGAVVDYTSLEQARTRAQIALDAAALGLQPTIYDKPTPKESDVKLQASNLLRERLTAGDIAWNDCAGGGSLPCAGVDDVTIDTDEGTLRLEASMEVRMSFVALVGVPTMRATLVSEATRKRLSVEVAMVLDNSGSMADYNRMGHLKAAANCATNVLLLGACGASGPSGPGSDDVKIGIVTFTEYVNVGTSAKTATWMDRDGISKVSRDNFDDDDDETTPFAGPVDRFDLYDQLNNVTWRGCVEARNRTQGPGGFYYDTSDLLPDKSVPDSLFVPLFAPDQPSGFWDSYLPDDPPACAASAGSCEWQQTRTGCNPPGTNCSGPTTITSTFTAPNGMTTTSPSACSCDSPPGGATVTTRNGPNTTSWGHGGNHTFVTTDSCQFTKNASSLSLRELQERMCKYTGNIYSNKAGPNSDCPSTPMLALTNNVATIKSRIGMMSPFGGTNIHQGVMWGFHMLSPTEPLTEGKPYDSATSKVMIVMTDGENTHHAKNDMNGADWYVAYGYPYNGRLGTVGDTTAQLQAEMNARTATTCENAKAAGITIYTVGLSSPNQTTTNLLTACASSPTKAYFPNNPGELTGVFAEIASELADLRLAE